jgi:hypothetical protein
MHSAHRTVFGRRAAVQSLMEKYDIPYEKIGRLEVRQAAWSWFSCCARLFSLPLLRTLGCRWGPRP